MLLSCAVAAVIVAHATGRLPSVQHSPRPASSTHAAAAALACAAAALETPQAGPLAGLLRVLVLHGRSQTGALLHGRLAPLRRRLAGVAELVFVDAPCIIPGAELREWWPHDGADARSVDAAVACAAAAWAAHGPFHALLGFSQGAAVAFECCARADTAFAGLRGVVLASGYAPGSPSEAGPPLQLPSLHLLSEDDAAVPAAASRRAAERFTAPQVHVHDLGHCVPQRAQELQVVLAFLQRLLRPEPAAAPAESADVAYELSEDVSDELSALAAIFGDEYELLRANPPRCRVVVAWREGVPWLYAEFALPRGYPASAPPAFRLTAAERGGVAAAAAVAAATVVHDAVEACAGSPALFAAATALREWASENATAAAPDAAADGQNGDDGDDAPDVPKWWEDETVEPAAISLAAAEAAEAEVSAPPPPARGTGGAAAHTRAWTFTVGLVGKPSAGKSTFYNAASRPRVAAAMSPHPFTTIEPNVAPAYFAAPCPCAVLGLEARCTPRFGKHAGVPGTRRMPVLLKDIAGLVPGAYAGRGRGNAFLADICDADTLIHVVDASGLTDSEGAPGAGDPLADVAWVRGELHAWIYSNVRAHWGGLRKRALPRHAGADPDAPMARLTALFSGYRAGRPAVLAALARAGLDANRLSGPAGLPAWGSADLHRLVACFLRVRFPVVLALNKADLPTSAGYIAAIRAALPNEAAVPVCARAEWLLGNAVAAGMARYAEGGASAEALPGADDAAATAVRHAQATSLDAFGSTGVLQALSLAVMARRPLLVLPVTDAATCAAPGEAHESAAALRDCVMVRPGSTLDDAFDALRRENLADGELVRAERVEAAPPPACRRAAVLRKEDGALRGDARGTLVLRLATKKGCAWQKRGSAAPTG